MLTHLLLFSDRIEVRRLGIRTRVVPLSSIENVTVSGWSDDAVNLRLDVRGEEALTGRVEAVLAWKYKLQEMLGLKDRPLPSVKADQPYRLAVAA